MCTHTASARSDTRPGPPQEWPTTTPERHAPSSQNVCLLDSWHVLESQAHLQHRSDLCRAEVADGSEMANCRHAGWPAKGLQAEWVDGWVHTRQRRLSGAAQKCKTHPSPAIIQSVSVTHNRGITLSTIRLMNEVNPIWRSGIGSLTSIGRTFVGESQSVYLSQSVSLSSSFIYRRPPSPL
jgi:hypothetical protein